MVFHKPQFEVRPSLITGDSADVYLHRTQRILRNEGKNPVVTMEFLITQGAVLCGIREVIAILERVTSEGNREVWSIDDGEGVNPGEVCLSIRAPYSSFGLYETAICGILAQSSGWATAAQQLVRVSNGIPIVSIGAHNVHPSVGPIMDYAAVIGGCLSGSTVLGNKLAGSSPIATVSGALLQLMGDPGRALLAFDRSMPTEVPRVGYVDPRGDVVAQTLKVAELMQDRLDAIRLARIPGAKPVPIDVIKEVRRHLDELDYQHVHIVLSGEMSPERMESLVAQGAPVDVVHDSNYIASSTPIPFRPTIRSINDQAVPQEAEPSSPNPRLMRSL